MQTSDEAINDLRNRLLSVTTRSNELDISIHNLKQSLPLKDCTIDRLEKRLSDAVEPKKAAAMSGSRTVGTAAEREGALRHGVTEMERERNHFRGYLHQHQKTSKLQAELRRKAEQLHQSHQAKLSENRMMETEVENLVHQFQEQINKSVEMLDGCRKELEEKTNLVETLRHEMRNVKAANNILRTQLKDIIDQYERRQKSANENYLATLTERDFSIAELRKNMVVLSNHLIKRNYTVSLGTALRSLDVRESQNNYNATVSKQLELKSTECERLKSELRKLIDENDENRTKVTQQRDELERKSQECERLRSEMKNSIMEHRIRLTEQQKLCTMAECANKELRTKLTDLVDQKDLMVFELESMEATYRKNQELLDKCKAERNAYRRLYELKLTNNQNRKRPRVDVEKRPEWKRRRLCGNKLVAEIDAAQDTIERTIKKNLSTLDERAQNRQSIQQPSTEITAPVEGIPDKSILSAQPEQDVAAIVAAEVVLQNCSVQDDSDTSTQSSRGAEIVTQMVEIDDTCVTPKQATILPMSQDTHPTTDEIDHGTDTNETDW